MAFIMQEPHPGLRQPGDLKQALVQMLQIANAQIQLVTADAIDNLLRVIDSRLNCSAGYFSASGLISCIGFRLASGTMPTRS